jgi:hypothetical protein
MNSELADYFFDQAANTFAFIVRPDAFSPPSLKIDESISFAYAVFVGKHLALESILDEREGDIKCKIARVIHGEVTSDYAIDRNGVRVREDLYSLLRRKGIQGATLYPGERIRTLGSNARNSWRSCANA